MNRRHLAGAIACGALLVLQTVAWSWKTSGVLQADGTWFKYPWGFTAIAHTPAFGDWPLMKENFIYLQQYQAFLGVPEQFVRPGAGTFEPLRTLYALLAGGLWFLGPIVSAIALNAAFWGLACVSFAYAARCVFPDEPAAPWVGALLVLSGQGFLISVGEVSPHLMGYSTGFWIAGYACAKRLWRADTPAVDHFLVHSLLGILKLAYEGAWLSFPFLIVLSAYASLQRDARFWSWTTISFLSVCVLLSLGPGALMMLMLRPFGSADSVSVVASLFKEDSARAWALTYPIVLADCVDAFGPFVLGLMGLGLIWMLRSRHALGVALLGTGVLVFAMTALVVMPASARGYVTFCLAAPLFILSTGGYVWLWRQSGPWRFGAPALLAACFLWANAPLAGFTLPLMGFCWGYITTMGRGHWQPFQVIPLS